MFHLPDCRHDRRGIGTLAVAFCALLAATPALAESNDLGTVDVDAAGKANTNAIGSKAEPGSAPALAPSQGNLDASQPGSVVSDKIIKDVAKPASTFLDVIKFTPGAYTTSANGFGDGKGGWRGFKDGQYNVTFDGIPFGDANDPSHHTGAFFPSTFLGQVTVDRGPGGASQAGYAPFGGTLSLNSLELQNKFGGNVQQAFGNHATFNTSGEVQSGDFLNGTKAVIAYSRQRTDGTLNYGKDYNDFAMVKVEHRFEDFTVTALASGGREYYNQVGAITAAQWAKYGKDYGSLGNNPATNNYTGYNDSIKQTDFEYIGLKGEIFGFEVENKMYTYAYYYPWLQNNGADLTCGGGTPVECAATVTKVNGTTIINTSPTKSTDVTGYIKKNDYRGYGDMLNISRNVDAGMASGKLRTGVWFEKVDNERLQQYIDYTTGKTFSSMGNSVTNSYKLDLSSHITNVQPFIEYEWHPIDRLSITPGYKFESFTRKQGATVNQTTLLPMDYSHTYTANLPFLAARYLVNDNWTVYAQASQGFLAPPVAAYYVTNPGANTVKPQTSDNYQAGFVYKSGRMVVDADVYAINASHFATSYTDPVSKLTSYIDSGKANYQGIEGSLTYGLVDNLSAYFSGSLSSAKFSTGMEIGNAPNYTAAVGAIYDDKRIFGSLLTKFIGDQYGSSNQVAGYETNKVSAYNSTDAVVGFRTEYLKELGFGQKAELKFGINNIFDNRSTTNISGDPSKGLSGLTYEFQTARTFYVNFKTEF